MSSRLIAWVGGYYFYRQVVERGHTVINIPMGEPAVFTWDDMVEKCGRAPDLVLYADRGMPPPLIGLEEYPCPTAFYAIDSHIHSWLSLYGQAFDLAAVSLRDHTPRFRRLRTQPCRRSLGMQHANHVQTGKKHPFFASILTTGVDLDISG